MAQDHRLAQLLQRIDDLRLFPQAAHRVLQVARDDRATLDDMQAAVASDPILAGRVLKMANSPLHQRSMRVDTLPRAIQMLGFMGTRDIALALALGSIGRDRSPWGEILWTHAMHTSHAAAAITAHMRHNAPKGAFLAALLHDVGRQLMLVLDPKVTDAIQRHEQSGGNAHALEMSAFGVDHATLGAACLARWSFTDAITDAVRYHHVPLDRDMPGTTRTWVAILELADAMAHQHAMEVPVVDAAADLALTPAAVHLHFRPARIEACFYDLVPALEAAQAA